MLSQQVRKLYYVPLPVKDFWLQGDPSTDLHLVVAIDREALQRMIVAATAAGDEMPTMIAGVSLQALIDHLAQEEIDAAVSGH